MLLILRSKARASKKILKFNKKLAAHLKKKRIDFNFASFEDAELFLDNQEIKLLIKGRDLKSWHTIYPRKVGSQRRMAFIMANMSKASGIQFIDLFNKDRSDTAKIVQMFKFANNTVSIPKTYYSVNYSASHLNNASKYLGFPIVIKQCNTSQGAGVFLVKNRNDLRKKMSELTKTGEEKKDIFLQEFLPNNFEYRVFVLGKEVGAVEKKIRTTDEFRNNVYLGAKEEFIDTSRVKKSILNLAIKAASVANIQVCGVDIVESTDGRIAVFEANSCPGITLDEKVSPELESLANYLSLCEKR